jgi:hypothetical protein
MVAVMAELDIEHVVGDGLGLGRRCVTENEFGFRINEFPDSSQSRLAAHVNDLLAQSLKTLVVSGLVGERLGRGLELDRSEFFESTPNLRALARPRTGEIKQKEKPRTRRFA